MESLEAKREGEEDESYRGEREKGKRNTRQGENSTLKKKEEEEKEERRRRRFSWR